MKKIWLWIPIKKFQFFLFVWRIVEKRVRFIGTFYPRPYFGENPYAPIPGRNVPEVRSTKSSGKIFHLHFPRGGMNNGCLSRYPAWISDPLESPEPKKKRSKRKKIWRPGIVPTTRTKFTTSIVDKVTSISCNATNFTTYREKVYKIY